MSPISYPAPRIATPPRTQSLALGKCAFVGIVAVGIGLRLAFSTVPLWNDEIWSLQNLAKIDGVGGILWGLSHDNNHFLNSVWLYGVSLATSWPPALRSLSIVAGIGAIFAIARLQADRGAPALLAAAALAALSFFQIVYGVEARGYAVATLALVFAYGEVERALEAPASADRIRLALACGLGFFAHLAFGPAAAGLACIVFVETIVRQRAGPGAACVATFRLFWPAALAMAPTLACLAAGYLHKGGFTIGAFTPFSLARAVGGVASLGMMTFGLDPRSFAQTVFALLGLPILVLAAILFAAPVGRKSAYLMMLAAFPVVAIALKLPNTHVARYFFAASPFLILLAADAFAALMRRGVAFRAIAVALLVGALGSNVAALGRLAAGESKPWTAALAIVAGSPMPTLSSSHDFNVGKSVAYFDATHGAGLQLVSAEKLCTEKPGWRIVETSGDGKAEATIHLDCGLVYRLQDVFDRDAPSQLPWALYRAVR